MATPAMKYTDNTQKLPTAPETHKSNILALMLRGQVSVAVGSLSSGATGPLATLVYKPT